VSPAGRVLVVDDDSDIRDFMAMLLEDEGFAVETAVHGGDALAKARTRRPDLVVLDLSMPVMSGWELIAVWRADSVMQCIPIVVTSAEVSVATAHDLGVRAYLRKPIDVERLLMTVQALLDDGGEDGRPG
jgi:DNA-binding response OmpR family regulator